MLLHILLYYVHAQWVFVVVVECQNFQFGLRIVGPLYHLDEAFSLIALHFPVGSAATRLFHSYHTIFGAPLRILCNCPVSSWPFATGDISVSATTTLPPRGISISQVEISAATCCLREAFSLISHFLRAPPRNVKLPC